MPTRDLAVRDQPGGARPSSALQARARADLARRTTGNTGAAALQPVESPALVRQRARAQRAQDAAEYGRVSKTFGAYAPPSFEAGESASQMTPDSPFSPGKPVGPYDGYSRTPRTFNYTPSYNVATRPRTHEQISFGTLQGLIETYDFAQICCKPGTRIITKRGLVPIEDVAVGDEVITHLGRWRRVTETMVNRPHAPARTLSAHGLDDLTVTGNHPVYAVDYRMTQTHRREAQDIRWVSADRLKPRGYGRHDGMTLPALDLPDTRPSLDVAAIAGSDYAVDRDGLLARTRGGRLSRVPATVEMDAALGRLLGWYLAEGSQGYGRTVGFSLGPTERNYAEQILADAKAVFGLSGTIKPTPDNNGLTVQVHSTILGTLFKCGTARTKQLPKWAWDGGREFFAAMLEAWSLGDGCRTERNGWAPRITVVTASADLAWQMRMVAIALGLEAFVVAARPGGTKPAAIRGRALNVADVQYRVEWREKPIRWGRASFVFNDRYLAAPLEDNAASPYDGPVYNLEVDEDHSYVTTGGTVHNCIYHRIDSIRSLDWSLVASDAYEGDVSGAIALAMKILQAPDGETPFDAWLSQYLYDILAFDAGTLYRIRNRGGQTVGLQVIDGKSIAPLLDYWGNTPKPPAEAYVQYSQGLPWNWLTTNDLIYRPFRKRPDSPYGHAPLESVLLNANTDLRFQAYFLQRFTDGNLPAAFASAPDTWTPQQIEAFQEYWDGFILGDQSFKSQIRWIPPGSKIAWSDEKDFTDAFSLFLMRKTASAFHVVPSDLGFTDQVNKSTGETQTDVQHRIGDVPLAKHLASIFTRFLQDDLRLPLTFQWDFGEEQDDRLTLAQADDLYVKMGAVSSSEVRELRFGKSEPDGKTVPRFIFSTRGGAVPLSALFAVSGPIDPDSGAPLPGAPLPHKPFVPIEGVEQNPAPPSKPLAVQIYGNLTPPAPNPQVGVAPAPHALTPGATAPQPAPAPVAKDGAAAPTAAAGPTVGITAATGIYSYDLGTEPVTMPDADDIDYEVAKSELATYRRYVKARKRSGRWKDFEFETIDRVTAHRLNDAGRLEVRKAARVIACAGLAVLAEDTGRVLMLQRGLDPNDPASGTYEFPGGHVEDGETPAAAAEREWQEETGLLLPADAWLDADPDATWTSADHVYRGFVVTIAHEAALPIRERGQVRNPDDPDSDAVEMIAWWNPAQLPGNPAVRPELLASMDDVQRAIALAQPSDAAPTEAVAPVEKAVPMLGGVPGLTKRSAYISLDLPAGLIPAVPGGVADSHITIVYCGRDVSDDEFAAVCDRAEAAAASMAGPLTGSISGRGVFPPSNSSDGLIPVFAEIELPGINVLRADLEDLSASEHTGFHPHVTRLYASPGDELPAPLPYTPVTFTHITVHCGDEQISFPFGQRGLGIAKAAGGGRPPKGSASHAEAIKRWPAWNHDLDIADHWAQKITEATTGALTHTRAERIAREFTAQHPPAADGHKPDKAEKAALAAAALAYLLRHHIDITGPLQPVLAGLHTDAYMIGAASAQALINSAPMQLEGWTPGDTAKAQANIGRLGAAAGLTILLGSSIDVAEGIASSRLAPMAAALAAGALAGSGPAVIAGALISVLAAGWRALTAAFTETTNASSAGAMDTYQANNVEYGEWELDPQLNNCATCVINSEAGPVPIGRPYPSGHSRPGIHVKCGCSIAPRPS